MDGADEVLQVGRKTERHHVRRYDEWALLLARKPYKAR